MSRVGEAAVYTGWLGAARTMREVSLIGLV